jgi:hypothetical protein
LSKSAARSQAETKHKGTEPASLWKPWRRASLRGVQAEADAGRARAAADKVVANFLLLRESGKSRQVSQKMATRCCYSEGLAKRWTLPERLFGVRDGCGDWAIQEESSKNGVLWGAVLLLRIIQFSVMCYIRIRGSYARHKKRILAILGQGSGQS